MPYLDSPEWNPVCQNCPLNKCVEDTEVLSTCPIRIARSNEIPPVQMAKIVKIAGLKAIKERINYLEQTIKELAQEAQRVQS